MCSFIPEDVLWIVTGNVLASTYPRPFTPLRGVCKFSMFAHDTWWATRDGGIHHLIRRCVLELGRAPCIQPVEKVMVETLLGRVIRCSMILVCAAASESSVAVAGEKRSVNWLETTPLFLQVLTRTGAGSHRSPRSSSMPYSRTLQ